VSQQAYEPDNRPLNPEAVEQEIRRVAGHITAGVHHVTNAHTVYAEASHAYDLAFARAYMAYQGPAHAKRYQAEIETEDERRARDVAEVAYNHARRLAAALTEELRAWQSVGASIREVYRTAGRGEY
jgi:hypothetical protein